MKNSTQTKFNAARVPKRHENDLSRVKDAVRKAAALFVFAMFIACAATPALAAGLAKITEIQGGGGASKSVGTGADPKYVAKSPDRTIYFGNYWQNPVDGHTPAPDYQNPEDFDAAKWKKEGIQWRVLSNDQTGTGTKRVLLLADQGLYATSFDADSNVWSTSVVRKNLTGLTDGEASTGKTYDTLNTSSFAHDAFNPKEYAAIADTTHIAGGTLTGYNISTTDKLFLLSYEEATNTDYGFTGDINATDTRKASPTAFAKSVKMYGNTFGASDVLGAASWWLRSPGADYLAISAYYVSTGGYVYASLGVTHAPGAVRAAFNLNQESVLFLSAAVGGKTSVAVGNGFKLADYDGSQGWKVTLINTDVTKPTDVTVTQPTTGGVDDLAKTAVAGDTIDLTNGVTVNYGAPIVKYTAAAISETNPLKKADCVSAILVSGDKYINYAKISSADSETAKEVPFGNLADGRYTMYIFAEAASGDKQTDYASDFSNENGYEFIKGSGKVYSGTLSKAYKDKDLTIKLGGNFDLGFEKDTYATKIIVVKGADDNKLRGGVSDDAEPTGFMAVINTVFDTEKPDDTDFTTLKELVTVKKEAKLACFNKIKFMNLEVNGDLTIEDDAVVELHEIEMGEGSAIYMKKTATLINYTEQNITVWDISGDEPKEVTVKAGESYNPSQEKPDPSKGGSSVGCNAGFGIAMLLSAAAAMICKRKRG